VGSATIDGTSAGTLASGLSISAAGSTVKGLEISNFAVFGIVVDASDAVIAANPLFGNATVGGGGISIASARIRLKH
jgi:hypothetical protein